MKRKTLVNIHLYISAFFTPFLLLIAFTGTAYLFSFKGSVVKKKIAITSSQNKALTNNFIDQELNRIDPNYSYEYLKSNKNLTITRPTTRLSYEFEKVGNQVIIYEVRPNFLKRLIEVHKGHGPRILKWYQKVLGTGLIFMMITGILISFTRKDHKKISLYSMAFGFSVLAALFYLL